MQRELVEYPDPPYEEPKIEIEIPGGDWLVEAKKFLLKQQKQFPDAERWCEWLIQVAPELCEDYGVNDFPVIETMVVSVLLFELLKSVRYLDCPDREVRWEEEQLLGRYTDVMMSRILEWYRNR